MRSRRWSAQDVVRRTAKGHVRVKEDAPSCAPRAVSLSLPWPPTTNHLYTYAGGRKRLSKAGRAYQEHMSEIWMLQRPPGWCPLEGRLHLVLEFHAPTHRDYDISNFIKCLEDGLTKAGVMIDDSQIDHGEQKRKPPSTPGEVAVFLEPMREEQPYEDMPDAS